MPLYKTITVNQHTKVLIWKIEESMEALQQGLLLRDATKDKLNKMKSTTHKKGILSVKKLLQELGYTDFHLSYNEEGKPILNDGKEISITHSHEFSGVIISNQEVGIDIEKQQQKILKIASKFTPIKEYRTLANEDALIRKLTFVWCAKEALYKLYSTKGVSFMSHMNVNDFSLSSHKTTAHIFYGQKTNTYSIYFLEFENFVCAYAI